MTGMFINSGCLFGIAKQAYERAMAETEDDDRSWKSQEPLISVLFAAATLEAFVNEIGEMASQPSFPDPEFGQDPAQVQNLAYLLSEVIDARGNINLKFLTAKLALTGKTFDKGMNPYQDFAILIDLRNSLMHLKFDRINSIKVNEVDIVHPNVINKLQSKNILAQFDNGENAAATWFMKVGTPAVARWACNTTVEIIKDIVESIPQSGFRSTIDLIYCRTPLFALIT